MLKTTVRYEYPSIPAGKPFTLRMTVGIIGQSKPERPRPLNLALALDKSGSMHGEKLKKALEATGMIAGMMGVGETFSLVTFDSSVETVLPPAKGADLKGIDLILNRIHSGSNTNLCGGYLESAQNALSAAAGSMSRVVLLSDGRANEGITDITRLAAIAADTRDRGVTTSTYGIGDDFDEDLMTAMAESGGGAAYYIDRPADAMEVFREEMDALRNLVGSGCRVTFEPNRKYVAGFRQLNTYRQESDNSFFLGDISAVEERTLVLAIDVPPQMPASDGLDIGHVLLTWLDAAGMQQRTTLHLATGIVPQEEFALLTRNADVAIEVAMLTISAAKREARLLGKQRRFEDAAILLETLVAAIEAEGLEDKDLAVELSELRERAHRLRTERERYMDARQSKMMMYESEHAGKGRRMSYMSQKERLCRTHMAQSGTSGEIIIETDIPGINSPGCSVEYFDSLTIDRFFHSICDAIGDNTFAREYGKSWILRDKATGRVLDIGLPWAKANGQRRDTRAVDIAGVTPGTVLQAVALPRLRRQLQGNHLPTDMISLDISHMLPQAAACIPVPYAADMRTCDFLARVFQMISTVVRPDTYGRNWVLRDMASGRVFDIGSPWAGMMGCAADVRPLAVVGITGGTMLQVVGVR